MLPSGKKICQTFTLAFKGSGNLTVASSANPISDEVPATLTFQCIKYMPVLKPLSCLFLCLEYSTPDISVQFSLVAQSCPTLCDTSTSVQHECWTAACEASLSITNSQSPHKLMSTELVMPSNHLIFCCPFLHLPSIFPSIRVFSNESALSIRWPKYWSFSFNTSPSNEHSGLMSFIMDWLDLLEVQGTLKSLL